MTLRIFLAGGTGVLGRRVVPALRAAGHDVTVNVRNDDARRTASAHGADAVSVDLFDSDAVAEVVKGHDAVVNVATSIPTGVRAIRPSAWALNDRLRTEASAHLAQAAIEHGACYVGESITFPYVDAGSDWITESHPRSYFTGNRSCGDAEDAAMRVDQSGGVGVSLRFAMFVADDSAHTMELRSVARRGFLELPGGGDAHISFIHIDDAASAVVAALDAPSGIYNVAEANPVTRRAHAEAFGGALGRTVRCPPKWVSKVAGAAIDSVSRSQRVSSQHFAAVASWEPQIDVVAHW